MYRLGLRGPEVRLVGPNKALALVTSGARALRGGQRAWEASEVPHHPTASPQHQSSKVQPQAQPDRETGELQQ